MEEDTDVESKGVIAKVWDWLGEHWLQSQIVGYLLIVLFLQGSTSLDCYILGRPYLPPPAR